MRTRLLLLILLASPAVPALAQDDFPVGWVVLADGPADSPATVEFVSMAPGWHLTTGPAALLYDPARAATGSFRVEAETYRFPGGLESGFGIVLGGSELEGPAPDYFAFLIDGTGRYQLHHRDGDTVHMIAEWTAHPAVVPWTDDTADNILGADVQPDSVRFFVNGEGVAAFARQPYMEFDGVIGLRVEEAVDLHVARLDVTPLAGAEPD